MFGVTVAIFGQRRSVCAAEQKYVVVLVDGVKIHHDRFAIRLGHDRSDSVAGLVLHKQIRCDLTVIVDN